MKKVLILTYCYPPTGGAGVQRILKFTKYLPQFSWQSFVIAPKRVAEEAKDETLIKEIPRDVKVWRTGIIEPRTWGFLKKFWKQEIKKETAGKVHGPSFWKKAINFIRDLLFIPDDSAFWLPFLVWRGWRVAKREKIDVIFATAPPYTTLLAGKILKRILKKPLVVDFRDPWAGLPEAHYVNRKIPAWRRRIDTKLEKGVLNKADKIVVVSPKVAEDFIKRCGITESKIKLIPNGFDEADFAHISKGESGYFHIIYAGSFYGGYNPFNFLRALEKFLSENPEISKAVKVKFIGRFAAGVQESCADYLKNSRVAIEFPGYLPHEKSIEAISNAHLLLLVVGQGEGSDTVIPGKTFEYLRSGSPILALCPKGGATEDLIKKTQTGLTVDPEDIEEIKKQIALLFNSWENQEQITHSNHEEVKKYERKSLTKELTGVLEELL